VIKKKLKKRSGWGLVKVKEPRDTNRISFPDRELNQMVFKCILKGSDYHISMLKITACLDLILHHTLLNRTKH